MSQHFVYGLDNEFMHESAKRLLDCARAATKDSAYPIEDFNDLAKRLPVSSAVMTNWKKRGVSKEGAIKAERLLGCSVQWILDGIGAAGPAGSVEARKSGEAYAASPLRVSEPEAQLIRMYRVLLAEEAAEVFDDIHRRAARVLGDKLLSERFGVSGYASDARVSETIKPAPTMIVPAPGDRRKTTLPVEVDRRGKEES